MHIQSIPTIKKMYIFEILWNEIYVVDMLKYCIVKI